MLVNIFSTNFHIYIIAYLSAHFNRFPIFYRFLATTFLYRVPHRFSLPAQPFSTGACRVTSRNENYVCLLPFCQNSASGGNKVDV